MTKLTDQTAVTAVDAADVVYVVDVSDTTDDAAGSSKKVTRADFGGPVLLETITNATAGEFDFSSIVGTYTNLRIKGYVQSDTTALDYLYVFLNADTTPGNYQSQNNIGNNNGTDVTEVASPRAMLINGTGQGVYNTFIDILIPEYASATLGKMIYTSGGGAYAANSIWAGTNCIETAVTTAVTQVRVRTDNHATDQLTGKLYLFGEKF
jgi:hypothetical protein